MSRKMLFVLTLTLLAVALPASATCDRVIDSKAYDDGGDSSFCWLSGNICYYCWGEKPDEHCASDWEPCEPSPKDDPEPFPIIASARPGSAPPCAMDNLQVVPQVKLEHLL